MEILIVVLLNAGLLVVVGCLGDLVHFPVPLLGIGLGKSDITSSSDVCTLLDGIGTDDVEVCSPLQSVTIVGNWLLLSDDSDAFVSIQCFVGYLHLEWEMLDLIQVEILHLGKL